MRSRDNATRVSCRSRAEPQGGKARRARCHDHEGISQRGTRLALQELSRSEAVQKDDDPCRDPSDRPAAVSPGADPRGRGLRSAQGHRGRCGPVRPR